jgi:hypothetical protein
MAKTSSKALFLFTTLSLAIVACGGPTKYTTVGVGSAQGADVQIEVEKNDANYELTLNVQNLLPPDRVSTGAKFFATWARVGDRPAVHLGNLNYDAEKRVGYVLGRTPHPSFDLLVTAEKADQPIAPSTDIVIRQAVTLK